MPLAEAVSGLLTEEWARFTQGVRNLDPAAAAIQRDVQQRRVRMEGEAATINIPGWDDVVKIAPAYTPTPAERQEARDARREGRPANLSAEASGAISRGLAQAERIRTSAQPDYMQAWGSILTAIDNVQDLASTIGTFGRLSIWGLESLPAVGGLVSPAARAALLKLGLGAAARAIPGVGAVLLVSDLLNLISLVGMLASPLYAMICAGPTAALAAGFPTAVFKRGLKSEVFKRARSNPFGREARARVVLKAASRRIGLAEVVEAAQTTEQLFGVGLSFGAVVGLLAETAAAVELVARGAPVQINAPLSYEKAGAAFSGWMSQQTTADVIAARQAAAVLATAPSIARVQPHFTDDEHLLTMLMLVHACGVMRAMTRGLDVDEIISRVMDDNVRPVKLLHDATRFYLETARVNPDEAPRWWLAGFPEIATLGAVVDDCWRTVPAAARAFYQPRAKTREGELFGTLVSQLAEHLWLLLTDNPEALAWSMTPDWRLITALAEDGYLLNHADGAEKLGRFWNAARAFLDAHGNRTPDVATWRELAAAHRVTLIPMLAPDAPWPAAWAAAGSSPPST